MEITITLNCSQVDLDDFCLNYNYKEIDKLNFFKKTIKKYVEEIVRAQRINSAVESVRKIEVEKKIVF